MRPNIARRSSAEILESLRPSSWEGDSGSARAVKSTPPMGFTYVNSEPSTTQGHSISWEMFACRTMNFPHLPHPALRTRSLDSAKRCTNYLNFTFYRMGCYKDNHHLARPKTDGRSQLAFSTLSRVRYSVYVQYNKSRTTLKKLCIVTMEIVTARNRCFQT